MEIKFDFSNVLDKEKRFFYMGIAMIGIIGYHIYLKDIAFYDNSLKIIKILFKYSYVGVDLFLFFSAYGLCHSFENSTLKEFYKKRFIRIIPIFLIFRILEFIVFRGETIPQFLQYRLLEITSLAIIQTPYTCPGMLSLGWFIPAIINLYLIFPLLFKLIRIINKNTVWHTVFFLLSIFWLSHILWGIPIHALYISRLPIIFTGIITYFYIKDRKYTELFLIYALFASMTFFMERNNLRLSCVVPLILYAINMYNFKFNPSFFKYISGIGKLSLEFYLAHCSAFILHFDNILYTWINTLILTACIGYILHIINKKVSKYFLKL